MKIITERSDLAFEAGFSQPEFGLFRDVPGLLHSLHPRLQPHGLKLSDVRVERGSGNVADHHLLFYLFDYAMTIRIRTERIEVACSSLPNPETLERYKAAIVDVIRGVKDFNHDLVIRAFAVAVNIHARLDGMTPREYLASYIARAPGELGPVTGNGAAFYFGPNENRVLASITLDNSAVVTDALFARIHAVWDAAKVSVEDLAGGMAEGFIRTALQGLDLQV